MFMPKRSSILVLAFGAVSFAIASCGQVESPVGAGDVSFGGKTTTKTKTTTTTTVSGTGVAHYMTDANGIPYYGIETAAGVRYEVLNFPSGAFTDGQTVNFSGWLMTSYTSSNNYGQALMLSAISAG
jgi:hypothetical protein